MIKEIDILCPFCKSNKIYEQVTSKQLLKANRFSEGPVMIEIESWGDGIFVCEGCGHELHTFETNEEEE